CAPDTCTLRHNTSAGGSVKGCRKTSLQRWRRVFSVLRQILGRFWPRALGRRVWGGLRRRVFDLGIAGRLGVAFAAVAVLAMAANVIAEHGTEIIETTAVVAPVARDSLVAVRRGTSAAAAAAETSPPPGLIGVAELHDGVLLEAIDRYERAVEHRSKSD